MKQDYNWADIFCGVRLYSAFSDKGNPSYLVNAYQQVAGIVQG